MAQLSATSQLSAPALLGSCTVGWRLPVSRPGVTQSSSTTSLTGRPPGWHPDSANATSRASGNLRSLLIQGRSARLSRACGEVGGDLLQLAQGGAEVFYDLFGNLVRRRQSGGVFCAFVAEPEDVQVGFIPLQEVLVAEAVEAFRLLALAAVLRVVAGYEIVQVGAGERVGLEGEMPVGAQVVDP